MIVQLEKAEEWDRASLRAYFPCVSYRYGWMTAISRSFPHLKMVPLAKRGESGEAMYVCPCFFDNGGKILISSPFLSPGFITENTSPEEILETLIETTSKMNGNSIELHVPPGYWHLECLLKKNFLLVQKICFFDLELNGVGSFDEFLKSYVSKDKVKNIRTSHSRGLIVDILPLSENSLHRFFPSYFDMIERNNSISLPKIYFTQIGKELKDSGKVWIASVGGVDAGSAITFESSGRIWSWFLQGDRKFKDYKVDARLYAEIIRYSIENNIPTVDFGTSPINSSLADFKMKFGANPVFHEKYLLNVSTKARLYYFLKKSLRPASN